MEPFSAFSTLGSSLTATVTTANFIFALHNTPNDVRACAQLVTRVYDDLQFLITLRNSHQEYVEASPIERQRLDGIITEAAKSLLAIGSKLEACRAEANGGKVPLMGRMKWILGDSASFVLQSRNLAVQQAAINSEINWLRSLQHGKGKDKEESKVIEAVFENLELLKLGSKKSMLFREQSDTGPAPPPYQENPSLGPSMDTVMSPVSFAGRQSVVSLMSFSETPDTGQYSRSVSRQGSRSEAVPQHDDPEEAFFRDLRMQEMEKRRRIAARSEG
ncbi:hypothetical protein BDZ45DRAFT_634169 [Acephala macrosclerotiorum]|nr:hypothetical protein BDZ45DRAFT_634169 [Acephala macrosclerotiorum]